MKEKCINSAVIGTSVLDSMHLACLVPPSCLQVKPECAADFENVWKNRESHLKEMPGFVRFALLKCKCVAAV